MFASVIDESAKFKTVKSASFEYNDFTTTAKKFESFLFGNWNPVSALTILEGPADELWPDGCQKPDAPLGAVMAGPGLWRARVSSRDDVATGSKLGVSSWDSD